jgi:hypothetical protein
MALAEIVIVGEEHGKQVGAGGAVRSVDSPSFPT